MNLGAALRRAGDVDGALAALKEATRLAPREPTAWANLGMVLSDKKSYDEAQAALDKATKLKPDFALAWNRLGRVALKRGELGPPSPRRRRRASSSPRTAFAADLLSRSDRAEAGAAGGGRVQGRHRARAQEPARPLRADEGPGRQGRLRGRQVDPRDFQGVSSEAGGQAAGRRDRRDLQKVACASSYSVPDSIG
jgi:tetratricopeptide (TPR) repeat protein